MKIATGLTLLAAGAIFAFAVRTSPPGINIHTVGWVIMLTGMAGILLAGRVFGWRRRARITVRRNLAGRAFAGRDEAGHRDRGSDPPYVLRDPAALASAILRDAELAGSAEPARTALDDAQVAPATPGLTVVGPADDEPPGQPGTLDDLIDGRAGHGRRR